MRAIALWPGLTFGRTSVPCWPDSECYQTQSIRNQAGGLRAMIAACVVLPCLSICSLQIAVT
ncbi:hypothetical protein BDV32DRAFT_131523 [Aspergillus pseudonomiae]|nr:hypothetical protein BDV32DRAFT_131523 [Aspergillus pseudonomiae]